jgi:hypothetical protein
MEVFIHALYACNWENLIPLMVPAQMLMDGAQVTPE